MTNEQLLQAIALDLKRAAMGYHSGSKKMADIFLRECWMKASQLNMSLVSNALKLVIGRIELLKKVTDQRKLSEFTLTYSTILLSLSK